MGLAVFFNFLVTIYSNVSEVVAEPMQKKTPKKQKTQPKQTPKPNRKTQHQVLVAVFWFNIFGITDTGK